MIFCIFLVSLYQCLLERKVAIRSASKCFRWSQMVFFKGILFVGIVCFCIFRVRYLFFWKVYYWWFISNTDDFKDLLTFFVVILIYVILIFWWYCLAFFYLSADVNSYVITICCRYMQSDGIRIRKMTCKTTREDGGCMANAELNLG